MLKKQLTLAIAVLLLLSSLVTACDGTDTQTTEKETQDKHSNNAENHAEDLWLSAIESGDLDKVKRLISEGQSIGLDKQGINKPLRFAVSHRQTAILRYLLEQGAAMETGNSPAFTEPGPTGLTANNILSFAPDSPEIISLLLRYGAKPNLIGTGERAADERPLLVAVQKGNLETVELLLKYGADPNLGGESPDTAIGWAIGFRHEAILKALIAANADVNILPSSGGDGTPLSVAQACSLPIDQRPPSPLDLAQNNDKFVSILKAAGAKSLKELCK